MKRLASLAIVALLAGCAHQTPPAVPLEQQVVKSTEYVIRLPPPELLTLPPRPTDINPDTATQADVSQWLISKEQYTVTIENQLKGIGRFFQTTQGQLDSSAGAQNTQLKALADQAQAQEAADAAKKSVDLNAVPTPKP